jgi:hypothetical protein
VELFFKKIYEEEFGNGSSLDDYVKAVFCAGLQNIFPLNDS